MDLYRKEVLKKVIFEKPYVYYFFLIAIGFALINAWINELHITGLDIFTTYRLSFMIPFFFFLLVVPLLVSLNITLVVHKMKELKEMNKSGSVGSGAIGTIGVFLGLVGGACPGCIAGLFPAILGLFGIAGYSLSVLPFNGLELQAGSSALMLIGAYYLTKPTQCKIDFGKKTKKK